jgi:hypothetical protein
MLTSNDEKKANGDQNGHSNSIDAAKMRLGKRNLID